MRDIIAETVDGETHHGHSSGVRQAKTHGEKPFHSSGQHGQPKHTDWGPTSIEGCAQFGVQRCTSIRSDDTPETKTATNHNQH